MPTRAVRLLIASTRQAGKEAKGAVSTETHEGTPLKSKLVPLDGDGITGAEGVSVRSRDELMTDPKTLKAFIDYGVANFPAERYDLILWDHGEGPASGYGIDENVGLTGDGDPKMMTFPQIVDALSDNAVTTNDADGDGKLDKFDFIDFDACLMGSAEVTLAISEYADRYVASAETEPGFGQDYRGWLNMLGSNPVCDSFELGKKIVDDYIYYYSEDSSSPGYGGQGTLAVIDTARFMEAGFPDALRMMDATLNAQLGPRADGEFLYYDELRSVEGSIRYSPINDIYRRVEGTGFVGRLESVGVRFRGLRGYCRLAELHDQRR